MVKVDGDDDECDQTCQQQQFRTAQIGKPQHATGKESRARELDEEDSDAEINPKQGQRQIACFGQHRGRNEHVQGMQRGQPSGPDAGLWPIEPSPQQPGY